MSSPTNDYVKPAWKATKPWLSWGADQCGAAAAYTYEAACDYGPVVADGLYRGSASACRKTNRAANYAHAFFNEYWYGGVSAGDQEQPETHQENQPAQPRATSDAAAQQERE